MHKSDFGTPELRRKMDVVVEDRDLGPGYAAVKGVRVMSQRLIDTLLRRRHITEGQFASASQLHGDWHMTGFSPNMVSILYDGDRGGGGRGGISESQACAHARVVAALRALSSLSRSVVIGAVIWDEQPSCVVRRCGFGQDYGMPRLREALDELCLHYGRSGQ